MSAVTVVVTATISDQNGDAVDGALVTAELTHTDVDTGYVVPEVKEYTADASGVVRMDLWPNERGVTETMYRIRAVHPGTGETVLDVYATIPDQDVNLHSVANVPAYDGKNESQLAADQARQDALAADADAATAESAKNAAQNAASSAQADAQTASDKLDSFEDRYWGAFSSDPATDPNGNGPDEGDLYANTTVNNLRVYLGGAWRDVPSTVKNNFAATSDPGVNDDAGSGYEAGSLWLNTNDRGLFVCVNNSAGAAVWVETYHTSHQPTASEVGLGNVLNAKQLKAVAVAATDGGTDAYTTTSGTGIADGEIGTVDFQSANTTTSPTLDTRPIVDRNGNALWAGALDGRHFLVRDATNSRWLVLDPLPTDDAALTNTAAVPELGAFGVTVGDLVGTGIAGALGRGAIVEEGSNSNGQYVRWESGLQLCWVEVQADLSVSGWTIEPPVPAVFAAQPAAAWSMNGAFDAAGNESALVDLFVAAKTFQWRVRSTGAGGGAQGILLTALGYWK